MVTLDLEPVSPSGPRTAQHAAVHALLDKGVGPRAIGRELGLARHTVRRLAHAASADGLLVGR
ncbi:hypothetical protein [Streptomyces sp. NPDC002550]